MSGAWLSTTESCLTTESLIGRFGRLYWVVGAAQWFNNYLYITISIYSEYNQKRRSNIYKTFQHRLFYFGLLISLA